MPTQLTREIFGKLRPLITWGEYGFGSSGWPFRLYYVRDCWDGTVTLSGEIRKERFALVLEKPSNILAPKKFQAKRGWADKSPRYVMEVRRILVGHPIISSGPGPMVTEQQICLMREPEAWYPFVRSYHHTEHEDYAVNGSDSYLSWPPSDDSKPIRESHQESSFIANV